MFIKKTKIDEGTEISNNTLENFKKIIELANEINTNYMAVNFLKDADTEEVELYKKFYPTFFRAANTLQDIAEILK